MEDRHEIDIERQVANKYRFYRIIGEQDRQTGKPLMEAHLFNPGELLAIADYVARYRGQIEQEAQEDDERNYRALEADMNDMGRIAREWQAYRNGEAIPSEEPTLAHCPYCQQWHAKGTVERCPLNPANRHRDGK